jgi:hypothetical protein
MEPVSIPNLYLGIQLDHEENIIGQFNHILDSTSQVSSCEKSRYEERRIFNGPRGYS